MADPTGVGSIDNVQLDPTIEAGLAKLEELKIESFATMIRQEDIKTTFNAATRAVQGSSQ